MRLGKGVSMVTANRPRLEGWLLGYYPLCRHDSSRRLTAQVRYPGASEPEYGETEPQSKDGSRGSGEPGRSDGGRHISLRARPLKVSPQQPGPSGPVPQPPKTKLPSTSSVPDPTKQAEEILNAILPPREWVEDTQLWIQQVSSTPSTRMDVVHLQEQLDLKLQQRQARETGICPVRRELYSQCFGPTGRHYCTKEVIISIWISASSTIPSPALCNKKLVS
ncbi:axonemal dynein light intermediate polypeptide 1 isoform X3 [Tamandua tetradactyla]|uniref:axonemal dynein light intermediate polypeptide 1 isoform X3 n=1 Tax=Tamandua tetradactyla TaxID=48850 RepID=UPI0040549EA4